MPQVSQETLQNLGDLIGQLKQHGLTIAPIQTQRPETILAIHNLVPNIRPFSGSYEQDGIKIDEWRVQMRLRLRQISWIEKPKVDEEFKANYILSLLSGKAFRLIKAKFIHKHNGGNPCIGYSDAQAVLEKICDLIRSQLEEPSEKGGWGM